MALRSPGGLTPRVVFWLTFVAMVLAIGGWSVANPDMAAPDEPAHAVKAAATVRGELVADESDFNAGRGDFRVPELFAQSWSLTCFAFDSNALPTCSAGVSGDLDADSEATSHVARYNPVYYALIGLPSLLPASEWTFTLMRLVSAVLNAALIALILRTVAELRRPGWVVLGVVAAITPMTIFTASSMTPQGSEILGAVLTTTVLAALVYQPDDHLLRRRLVRLVVACAAFVLTRGLSPAYLLLVVVAVIVIAPSLPRLGALMRRRPTILAMAACGVVSVAALAYTLLSGSLSLGVVYPDPTLTPATVVSIMLENTDYYIRSMIGDFGWGDTPLPGWLLMGFASAIVAVTAVALALGTIRERIVLLGLALATLALPIVFQLRSFEESGIVWQGKYVLPIAVTVPVLAGFVVARHLPPFAQTRRIVVLVVGALAIGQVIAFVTNLHRYVNGLDGPWLSLVDDAWIPRAGLALPLVVETVAWIAFTVVIAAMLPALDRGDPLADEQSTEEPSTAQPDEQPHVPEQHRVDDPASPSAAPGPPRRTPTTATGRTTATTSEEHP